MTRAVRDATAVPLDVHLMIEEPERHVAEFIEAGANRVTIHVEAESCDDPAAVLRAIREAGALPGLAVNPGDPLEETRPYPRATSTLLLVMTVHPGKGGQHIVPGWEERVAQARRMREEARPPSSSRSTAASRRSTPRRRSRRAPTCWSRAPPSSSRRTTRPPSGRCAAPRDGRRRAR